jgi:hypothetical protein
VVLWSDGGRSAVIFGGAMVVRVEGKRKPIPEEGGPLGRPLRGKASKIDGHTRCQERRRRGGGLTSA